MHGHKLASNFGGTILTPKAENFASLIFLWRWVLILIKKSCTKNKPVYNITEFGL
jgi:hypothetical protein